MNKLETLYIDVEKGIIKLNGELLPQDTDIKLEKVKGSIFMKVENEYEGQIIPF